MKKVLVLILLCVFVLAGCSGKTNHSGTANSTSSNSNSQSDSYSDIEKMERVESVLPDQTADTLLTETTVLHLNDMSITVPTGWYYTDKSDVNALWLKSPNGALFSAVYNQDGMQAAIDDAVEFMHTMDDAAGFDYYDPQITDDTIGNVEGKQLNWTYKFGYYKLAYAYLFADYNGNTYTFFCNTSNSVNENALDDFSVFKTTVVPTIVFA